MFLFFLKKNFCDTWDNIFYLIVSNIPCLVLAAGVYFSVTWFSAASVLYGYAAFILSVSLLMAYVFSAGVNARKIADFNSPKWNLLLQSLKKNFIKGFLFGLILTFTTVAARLSLSFYLTAFFKNAGLFYLLPAVFIAWFYIWFLGAMQWFIPLYYLQEDNTFAKNFKKSWIIFFDNTAFSFLMLIHTLLQLVLTGVTFALIPGFNGITLSLTNALRLRLYKYDWLEENPDYAGDREKLAQIPWDELIAEDKESLGPRNLKSFLMPWK